MWPKAVVPRAVERQLPFECLERIWDNAQTSSAFAFDSSNPTLNHRQAPILPQSSESMPNSMATAPPSESLRDELLAVVRDEVVGSLSRPPEGILKKSPISGEMIDGNCDPPAEGPDLGQGEGEPGGPEAQRGGNGREIHMPEVIRMSGSDDASDSLRILL